MQIPAFKESMFISGARKLTNKTNEWILQTHIDDLVWFQWDALSL